MPSTPLRNDPEVLGAGDTERPPAPFGPEPSSGVAAIEATPPEEKTKIGTPPMPGAPSSGRLVAAPPRPSVPRVPTILHAGSPPVEPPPVPIALTRRCTSCNERYPPDFLVCPRDASPLVDESGGDADPLVGKLIGESYQIVRVVGEGGMGRVYEARHLRLKERRFAVKTLHGDLARNGEIVARFMREAESASSLSHPNVVDVFDVHHLADGTPYFVAELLEGEELADYVRGRGPLEPRQAASVVRQVCRGLAAAHARGIIHRDMKPENIFVLRASIAAVASGEAQQLQVKVLDFGISTAGGAERTSLTRTGVIMGTPSYMSPEQARGKHVDLRADVYSTGAVLYFALTGIRPFDSEDPTSTISMVLTQDPKRPREIDARIPEALELIVQRAMAKDPNERFQTMAELERALAAFDEGGRMVLGAPSSMRPGDGVEDLNRSSAQRAFDIAKRMLSPSLPSGSRETAALARVARPTIVIMSAVLGLWLVGGTTASLAGLVRVLHDGEITLTECVLLVVGCLFAAATPIALYVLHVKKVIWPNSVRALQLAMDLKRTTTATLVCYGALSIVARIGHTVLWRSSKGLMSGYWDIALFLGSLLAAGTVGGLAALVRNMRKRRSSSS